MAMALIYFKRLSFIKAASYKAKSQVMALFSIRTEPNIKASGKTDISQDLGQLLFLTALDFSGNSQLTIKILIHLEYLLGMKNQQSKHGVKMDF